MVSNSVVTEECAALENQPPAIKSLTGRGTNLGHLKILRVLPIKDKRLVGPGYFLDWYGPYTVTEGKPIEVTPHSRIRLQTVTWLLEG
jgi:quercetin 2,3-dioxygenase